MPLTSMIAVGIALSLVPASRAASPYLPGDESWFWHYEGFGTQRSVTVLTPILVHGEEIVRLDHVQTGADPDAWENYWSDDGSRVYLRGFTNWSGVPLTLTYDPPILWVDPPLFAGKTWTASTDVYEDLEGKIPAGFSFLIEFRVTNADLLEVPAGKFPAHRIEYEVLASPRPTTLTGEQIAPGRGTFYPYRWEAAGVGVVRDNLGATAYVDLTSFGSTVSVESISFSDLKGWYRAARPEVTR
ncbi:MAG: hypothetical protein KC591_00775 [Gemmatimonadetes bacterium]|nr:hypothetical protein [Gemmatimonadota bacterium]